MALSTWSPLKMGYRDLPDGLWLWRPFPGDRGFDGDEDRDKKSEGGLTLCQDPAAHL